MKHTSEPWQFGHFGTESFWIGPNETTVSVAFVPHDCDSARDESRENARRIVACVNALEGVPTDWLESFKIGNVSNVLQDLSVAKNQRDERGP